ncbi:MAG: TerB family tellurite resistance protein [Sandaracinaceae bacterium]
MPFDLLGRLRALLDGDAPRPVGHPLRALVDEHMASASEASRRIVTAVVGLMATVAHADARLDAGERAKVREVLARFSELPPAGADAIVRLLAEDLASVALASDQRWIRDLREDADPAQRREVLDVLVELAAADGSIAHLEANLLRRLTTRLGLDQGDYVDAQARHRDKLAVLKNG